MADVLVDGQSVGAVTSYTFPKVTADHTITATFVLCVTFALEPRSLNLKSQGRWVNGTIRVPALHHASEIDVGSIRLNGVVRAAPDFPGQIAERDSWLTLKFSREEVQRTLTPGEQVPVSVTGMLGGAPFVGTDHITVGAPGRDRLAAGEQAAENRAAAFALRAASPAHGPLLVSFSLASHEPATLAVYDIGGRLVEARALDAPGPGSQVLRFGDLPTGIYLLRLPQGERRLTTRAVVIR